MTPRRIAVIVAALLGACVGALGRPVWHDALEPAQVLAGLVVYPSDAPVGQYSVHTWTLLHQLPAVGLWLGLGDTAITTLISAALGALAAGGLALVLALGRPSALIIACAPILILQSGLTAFQPGYPVGLFGLPYTYGAAAQFLGVVTLALAAHGATRSALFLLGVFPAIHITFGILLWPVAALTWRLTRQPANTLPWRWGAAGLVVALSSAALHHLVWVPALATLPPLLPTLTTSPDELAHLLAGARTHWDSHRAPIAWTSPSVITALLTPPVLLIAWRAMPSLPPASRRWPMALMAALLVGLAGAAAASLWPTSLFATLLPTRLWNLGLFTLFASALGLALGAHTSSWIRAWACGVLLLLSVLHAPSLPGLPDHHGALVALIEPLRLSSWIPIIGTAGAALALAGAVVLSRTTLGLRRGPAVARVATPVSLVCLTLFTVSVAASTLAGARDSLASLTPPPALVAAASRSGAILTAGDLHLVQGVTRRPVVLDGGALDFLPYVPTAAPITDRILRDLYETSLSTGDPDQGPAGTLRMEGARAHWESRSPEEWMALATRWQFTDIVTPSDWRLQLPALAIDRDVALWSVRSRRP